MTSTLLKNKISTTWAKWCQYLILASYEKKTYIFYYNISEQVSGKIIKLVSSFGSNVNLIIKWVALDPKTQAGWESASKLSKFTTTLHFNKWTGIAHCCSVGFYSDRNYKMSIILSFALLRKKMRSFRNFRI